MNSILGSFRLPDGIWGGPRTDASATEAINNLKTQEAFEDLEADLHNLASRAFPGMPAGPKLVNKLTGAELHGAVLEGVMDRGNERAELGQFQALRHDPALKLDPAAQRVLAVVDKWAAIMHLTGRSELTTDQKAQFAADLAAAAEPQLLDDFSIPDFPWCGFVG